MSIVELTQQLVEFQSLSYYEFPLMQFIADWLDRRNLPYTLDVFNPARFLQDGKIRSDTANIYIDIGQGVQTLMLYAHGDVVEGHPELFQPRIEDDRLFGWGTVDMKSSLAGLMLAADKHRSTIETSGKRIIFAIVADEETSGTGAQQHIEWLSRYGLTGNNLWCILTEPTDNFSYVEVGGKGYVFLDLEGDLANILDALKAILFAREKLLAPYLGVSPEFGKPFVSVTSITCIPEIATDQIFMETGRTAHASRPNEGENALEKMLLNLQSPIVNIHTGGNSRNVIPDRCVAYLGKSHEDVHCKATLDIRTNLVADFEDNLLRDVQIFFEQQPDITYRIRKRGKAYQTTDDSGLLSICRQSVDPMPALRIAQGGSDVGYYGTITSNVIGGFGPGENRLAHTDIESIHLATLDMLQGTFSKLIQSFIET